ncbi:MAG TPA: translation elongation factor Ts [Exilispira sp.]|nr:translation elongation factor Ts [Exilispira sp.]
MTINKEDVKKLREMTGVGIGDCKNALEEANGNFDKAIEIIKEKGLAKAVKKADRAVGDGRIAIYKDQENLSGALVKIECETDFVSNSEPFREFADTLVKKIYDKNITSIDHLDDEIEKLRSAAVLKFNENIKITDICIMRGDEQHLVFPYVQMGKNGAIVEFELNKSFNEISDSTKLEDFKYILYSIVVSVEFYKPEYYSLEDVPAEKIEEEMKLVKKQLEDDPAFKNKPENVLENIIKGKAKNSFIDKVFLECPYVREQSKKVRDILSEVEKTFGIKVKANKFYFTQIGS